MEAPALTVILGTTVTLYGWDLVAAGLGERLTTQPPLRPKTGAGPAGSAATTLNARD